MASRRQILMAANESARTDGSELLESQSRVGQRWCRELCSGENFANRTVAVRRGAIRLGLPREHEAQVDQQGSHSHKCQNQRGNPEHEFPLVNVRPSPATHPSLPSRLARRAYEATLGERNGAVVSISRVVRQFHDYIPRTSRPRRAIAHRTAARLPAQRHRSRANGM
jgi:hypothetical protein